MRLPDPIRRRLLTWARDWHCEARSSDFLIENAHGPYLARWYVIRQGNAGSICHPKSAAVNSPARIPASTAASATCLCISFCPVTTIGPCTISRGPG